MILTMIKNFKGNLLKALGPFSSNALQILFLIFLPVAEVYSQDLPWSVPLRGSWVQAGQPGKKDIVLVDKEKTCTIVVGNNESSAVKQAAAFLASDIEKISGKRPPVMPEAGKRDICIRLATVGNGEIPDNNDTKIMKGQWESYRVITSGHTVWLIGSDALGTAYAAYTLSERLGIDPLYIWTGYRPERHNPLVLKQTYFRADPPAFRYRGFFHDDEDILPRPFDANGYPLTQGDVPMEWYKRFFETALRLRMNMVAPYTRVHRRYEVQKTASDWGLYYTSHHYDILLSNPYGFTWFKLAEQRGVKDEWDWFTNKEGMLRYWQGGVTENGELNAIWPVGLRGTDDHSFKFPEGMSEEQKSATFRKVIRDQVDMVKKLVPADKKPVFTFTMYGEMLDQYLKNQESFDLPDDVIIVWIDNNDGVMCALPKNTGRWKHGVYYHLSYWWGRYTKQETHTVAPSTIAEQFNTIVKAGATEYMLLNVSELRDYVMGARMIADITWDAKTIYSQPDPADRYINWWSQEYFSDTLKSDGNGVKYVRDIYHRYSSLLNTADKLWLASDVTENLIDKLYHKVAGTPFLPFNPDTLALLQSRIKEQEAYFAVVNKAKSCLNLSQQRFFYIDNEIGPLIDYRHTQAALKLYEALNASTSSEMWKYVTEAREPLEKLEGELLWAEYPPFDLWYHETWARSSLYEDNPHRAYKQLRSFVSKEGTGHIERIKQPWW